MRILAFETSAETASVALLHEGVVEERTIAGRGMHSETLLPLAAELLAGAGLSIATLDALAFGTGPGAFTGLRLACGVAQGLAIGADKPVVPVGTLEALASQCAASSVYAATDARMGEIYYAAYQRDGDRLLEVLAPACAPPALAELPTAGRWQGMGSAFLVAADVLSERFGGRLDGYDAQAVPLAASVARLAAVRFARGEVIDPMLAAPLYVRDKVAFTTAERLARGGRA
ncbi:MAG: tRNA (adenosine(37)-N6)-threonylcarbamoyltransferase complex dimerization subunit type 1 TsaB [Zoogloea sp.]|nr:tRNA (adenosine(37)-N6)-threonylcarbamoyltransferase complex dimerization subunit type 1 TsaB [Zoogloea sp.]